MIKDLFSHKIHSSHDSWANKLIDLAFVFSEFDGQIYDRSKIEERLSKISPRASTVARDPSKFRDEISAYPAYLGLYRIELINDKWHFVLSDTARRFLINEEPNVAAFMLLQLILFQYPNGMGTAYFSNSDKVRIQANTRDRTLDFINQNIRLSPLRLICKGIEAKGLMNSESIFNATISYDEIFTLANDKRVNTSTSPKTDSVIEVLNELNAGVIQVPKPYESRFHILKHSDFLVPEKSGVSLRNPVNTTDYQELSNKFRVINQLDIYFQGFDRVTNENELLHVIKNGSWGRYFDGVRSFNSEVVEILTSESGILEESEVRTDEFEQTLPKEFKSPLTYTFRKRNQDEEKYSSYSIPREKTDPEITRIKRQKSNLNHKVILQQLEEYLENKGCDPVENEHIDLFAEIPGDGKFLFEVKSATSSNLLSQTRKGVSQLYEYRFRYQEQIGYDVSLCLVFPKKPDEIDWIEEYLCKDRNIGVIWFGNTGELEYSELGKDLIKTLL